MKTWYRITTDGGYIDNTVSETEHQAIRQLTDTYFSSINCDPGYSIEVRFYVMEENKYGFLQYVWKYVLRIYPFKRTHYWLEHQDKMFFESEFRYEILKPEIN